jgi:hypothetical protein
MSKSNGTFKTRFGQKPPAHDTQRLDTIIEHSEKKEPKNHKYRRYSCPDRP